MSILRLSVLFIILISPPVFSEEVRVCQPVEELEARYLPQNKYNEFVEALSKLKNKDKQVQFCIDYYKAKARYDQLKYLEEKQLWDDYFANGNSYREQIVESTKKVIGQVGINDPLKLKSLVLLWQFHRDQQDAFSEQALTDLMSELNIYGKSKSSSAELIKDTADKLLSYDEKANARITYKLYVDKLIESELTQDQLKNAANSFYKDGNLELAMSIFDIYIDKISKTVPKEKITGELFEIAGLFIYKPQGFFELDYAEKVYQKIEEIAGIEAFNQETIYLRAFNLEKLKEYKKAGEKYLKLTEVFPGTPHYDEAIYKLAVINAYALADLAEARKYFGILTAKPIFSPQVIYSFYHLGLLAQWEGDNTAAKDNYDLLLKNAAEGYSSITSEVRTRLKEIEENSQISHNLKTFLDLSLKKNESLLESDQLDLKISPFILERAQSFTASSSMNMPQSGCNQVQLQYLWSGDLGAATPTTEESSFQGAYPDTGTKTVNLVIISPTGAVDKSFIMTDVY